MSSQPSGLMSMVRSIISSGKSDQPAAPQPKEGNPDPGEERPEREIDPDCGIDDTEAQNWMTRIYPMLKGAFTTFHQMCWQSLLFYVGQTWLTWDVYRKTYTPSTPEDDFTPQPRINYFSPTIDAVASNFNSIPRIEFVAKDSDGDEQYKRDGIARVCNRLADDFIIRASLKSDFQSKGDKPSMAAQIFVLTGTLMTYVMARDKEPIESAYLGTISEKQVEMEITDPMVVLYRPGASQIGGIDGTPYTMLSRRMTIEEIYTRFQLNAEVDSEYVDSYNSTYENALNYYYTGFNSSMMQFEDSALVTEVFVEPASNSSPGVKQFAKTGMYGLYINGRLKYYEPWSFPEHPLTKISYLNVPRLFFARTIAFDVCPVQEELQGYESLIKLHGMTSATSPWVVDENTLVSDITGRADKVIKYRSLGPNSARPAREHPGTLDNGIYETVQRLRGVIEQISGAASVFRGRQEGSVVASSAIAQLRGQAELMFAKPVDNWNNGWKETVRKAVLFMQKCYTLPQITRIVGDGLAYAIQDFLACDLNEVVECIASAHGLPRTQDEMRQEMLMLFDKKALDIKDPNVKERMFQLFGETGMLTNFNLDATRARFENKGMVGGTPPVFRPAIEDLATHYTIHTEFVKSLQFDRLPPNVQELFLAHVMETKAAMAPPPAVAPPPSLAVTAKMEDLPPALTDAILASHGITVAVPDAPPPPHHSTGKPTDGTEPPPMSPNHTIPHTGGTPGPLPGSLHNVPKPAPATPAAGLASEGKATGSPSLEGQGVHKPVNTPSK